MLPCVDQTPPAGGGAAPRRANSEVGELGCCWGSWARVTLRVKYSLFVHRCRRATSAAKVITTATTTGVTAARLQLHHQGCWWGSWARVTLRMSTHCSCTDAGAPPSLRRSSPPPQPPASPPPVSNSITIILDGRGRPSRSRDRARRQERPMPERKSSESTKTALVSAAAARNRLLPKNCTY